MRVLLVEGLIDAGVLLERIALMVEIEDSLRVRMERWVHALRAELADPAF